MMRRGMGWEDWLVALGRAGLSVERREGHEITIRWIFGVVPSSRAVDGVDETSLR